MGKILVIDNETVESDQLQEMLDGEGYEFLTASSAEQARAIVEQRGPELTAIILDWVMSDADGVELLGWIKAHPRVADVEVIVHSAEFDPRDVKTGIESGAYYYLTKPFDEPQLEAIVRAAVSSLVLKQRLVSEVQSTEDAFRLLDIGRFRFRTIEEADRLAVHIASACGQPDATIALRELFVNAVEHGNLGITYEEKSALMESQSLEAERAKRLAQPQYKSLRAEITLQQVPSRMEITLKDEGPGFDFERYQTMDEDRLFDLHGRGVLIATSTLDVEYLPPGNHVRISVPVAKLR